jgi:hypothetical protein
VLVPLSMRIATKRVRFGHESAHKCPKYEPLCKRDIAIAAISRREIGKITGHAARSQL